jgi:hypothetical protein
MSEVKRYAISEFVQQSAESKEGAPVDVPPLLIVQHGRFVREEDFAALESDNAQLRAENTKLKQPVPLDYSNMTYAQIQAAYDKRVAAGSYQGRKRNE